MHAISSYRGNRPTNKHTHKHTNSQTGPLRRSYLASSVIKRRTGEDMGEFSVGSINKAVLVYRDSLLKVREGWWKT